MEKYNPKNIEKKWQEYWDKNQVFQVKENRKTKKFYCLEMFPYPSGEIHMGHVRNYVIGDVIARYKKVNGFNVLHPMGWDAFGLPAENAAIKHGVPPAKWTYENIDYMKTQLKKLGLSYDWQREITTCKPEYYKWNQWFFLKMFERGLAYRKASFVNWCPSCETVLANEQVIDSRCWRCESMVTQKELEQWFLKITAYAEELLSSCDTLKGWPEKVITMQKNWIGRSEGIEVDFDIVGFNKKMRIFTTRQDTLYGATFVSIAKKHPLVLELIKNPPSPPFDKGGRGGFSPDKIMKEIEALSEDPEKKEGVSTGHYAVNPLTGDKIPIWVANFVLLEYGTGAIMAVPAHDQRDFEFARKYNLPIKVVIVPEDRAKEQKSRSSEAKISGLPSFRASELEAAYEGEGILINSGQFSGLPSEEAKQRIANFIEANAFGKKTVNYKLRDWGISRQRYWGTPIPIIYCKTCGVVPVPENELPVLLPKEVTITGKGGNPLSEVADFINTKCPSCGKPAKRETDTMDTFVDSSWYFIAYCFEKGNIDFDSSLVTCLPSLPTEQAGRQARHSSLNYWMPVEQYIGGIEHAVLHLLYSRFFTKVLRDIGIVKIEEPFQNLLTQGMVIKEGAKMSKSKGNIVDPDYLIETYGADTVRLFCLFAAPPEKDLEWSDHGVEGAYRFLNRLWGLVYKYSAEVQKCRSAVATDSGTSELPSFRTSALIRKTHQTIKKVTEDIERQYHFNTAIAALMELTNEAISFSLQVSPSATRRGESPRATRRGGNPPMADNVSTKEDLNVLSFCIKNLILLISPFAPHIAEELWEKIGEQQSILREPWPVWDKDIAKEEEVELVIQINGKLKDRTMVPVGLDSDTIKEKALQSPKVLGYIKGKSIKKVIVVKDRLVNIVTN